MDFKIEPLETLFSKKEFNIPNDSTRSIVVYDNLIPSETIHKLYVALSASPYRAWRINTPSKTNGPVTIPCDYLQLELDIADFKDHSTFKIFEKIASEKIGAPKPKLSRIFCNVFQYGDTVYPHEDYIENADTNSVSMLIFLNEKWHIDWGGETYFFGEDKEPIFCIGVKPGRIIAFDSNIVHRAGVPNRNCHDVRITLNLRFYE